MSTISVYGENATRFCPKCKADWRGSKIPEKHIHMFEEGNEYFSRLVGLTCLEKDRVVEWMCPDCNFRWNRDL